MAFLSIKIFWFWVGDDPRLPSGACLCVPYSPLCVHGLLAVPSHNLHVVVVVAAAAVAVAVAVK